MSGQLHARVRVPWAAPVAWTFPPSPALTPDLVRPEENDKPVRQTPGRNGETARISPGHGAASGQLFCEPTPARVERQVGDHFRELDSITQVPARGQHGNFSLWAVLRAAVSNDGRQRNEDAAADSSYDQMRDAR